MEPTIEQVMDHVKAQVAAGNEQINLDDAEMIVLFKATVDRIDQTSPLSPEWGFDFIGQAFDWWPDGLNGKRHTIQVGG